MSLTKEEIEIERMRDEGGVFRPEMKAASIKYKQDKIAQLSKSLEHIRMLIIEEELPEELSCKLREAELLLRGHIHEQEETLSGIM